VVQALQINGGRDNPAVRTTNTAEAIAALARSGAISAENAARLSGAHDFLLNIINALRMVRGNSRDLTVPEAGSEEFAFLSRRLGYGEEPARLWAALEDHMEWVQRLEGRLLG
jgi:glutamate-ammonia-ligase adenylyltransferase